MYCSELLGWTTKEEFEKHRMGITIREYEEAYKSKFYEVVLVNGVKVGIGTDYITIDGLIISQEKLKEIIENAKKET